MLDVLTYYEVLDFLDSILVRGIFAEPKLGVSCEKTKYQPITDTLRILLGADDYRYSKYLKFSNRSIFTD